MVLSRVGKALFLSNLQEAALNLDMAAFIVWKRISDIIVDCDSEDECSPMGG